MPIFDNLQTIVLDFDGTLVDSISAYCAVYTSRYGHKKGFVPPDPSKVRQWNLKDQCPLEGAPESIFADPLFFYFLSPFPGAENFLLKAKKEYNLWICSVGTPKNIELKTRYIKEELSHDQMIMIVKSEASMGKDFVHFDNAVIIDDHEGNLINSRIHKKICFGQEYPWNENWNGLRAHTMSELSNMLIHCSSELPTAS